VCRGRNWRAWRWVSSAWVNVVPDLEAVPIIDDSGETAVEEEGDDPGDADSLPPAPTPALQQVTAEPTPASS